MAGVGAGEKLRSRSKGLRGMSEAKETPSSSEASEGDKSMKGSTGLYCFLGIFISYFVYGLLQEKMSGSSGC